MNSLLIKSADWLVDFKQRVAVEQAIFQTLIQWGLTESASDIHRLLDERFNDALTTSASMISFQPFQLSRGDQAQIASVPRDFYLKTRSIPRHRGGQERLHNALLTGFEELLFHLLRCYQDYLARKAKRTASKQAA
jgi:hypothetical protein